MAKKIAITGGHSTGLALLEEVRKVHPDWKVYYFGQKYALEGKKAYSFDYKVVSKIKKITFIPLVTGRLQRKLSWSTFPSLFKVPFSFFQSLFELIKIKPDIIVSFGGHVSTPVVFAGYLLGIPSITHEQTNTIGLANKINLLFVKKFAVSFKDLLKKVPAAKGVYTGMLVRDLKNRNDPGRLKKIAVLISKSKKKVIFITGGKSGAQIINNLILEILPELLQDYFVLHQVGTLDFEKFKKLKKEFYYPFDILADKEWQWVMNRADLIISRSGANITFELMFLRKPSILIPIPWSYQDEQKKNALLIKKIGGGEIIDQERATGKQLLKTIRLVLNERTKYIKNLRRVKIKNGKKNLLVEIESLFE